MHGLSIAIIDSNMLVGIGLQQIIKDIMPADIQVFNSFEELRDASASKSFVHYFVASRIYFEHTAFFRDNARKSVILVNGDMQINGMKTLNVCQSEKMLVKSIMSLHSQGHRSMSQHPSYIPPQANATILSPRETEVTVLLAKGRINKEIADQLNISTTTVITHRKNITRKTGIKTVAGLTVYALLNNLIDMNTVE